MSILPGWTPKTDLLLRCPSSASSRVKNDVDGDDGHRVQQHGGFDIIDHAFDKNFPSFILNELQIHGWMDQLKPALTKMDVDLADLIQSFTSTSVQENDKSGTSSSISSSSSTRGDISVFLPRHERRKKFFPTQYPYLHKLISSIEHTVDKRIGKQPIILSESSSTPDNNKHKSIIHFDVDTNLTSIQIAKYVGDGKAGYPRHCDRVGGVCLDDESKFNNSNHHNLYKESNGNSSAIERILTFVYYLTPEDWDPELDGGALRMFSPMIGGTTANDHNTNHDLYFDIVPYSDRLVVFRSDLMEHQVLPSLRRDRIAITIWLYGKIVRTGPSTEEAIILPSDLDLLPSALGYNCLLKEAGSSLPPPLPVSSSRTTTDDEKVSSIFVAIPSYRDEETWPTIKSLVEMACLPERVFIGVVFQVDTASEEETSRFTTAIGSGVTVQSSQWSQSSNFRSIIMDCRHSTGPCYARHLAQTLHRGEDYVLQIDSHMRFRLYWDEYLIHQLSKTECPEKALLTTYPPGYEPQHGPGPNAETRPTILVPWKFEDGILRQKGRLLEHNSEHALSNDNIPCLLYAGGFNFFHSSILKVCPYDSTLHGLFFGEEISMAVRLYTHGINLYAPPQTVCYHLWKRNPLRIRVDYDPYREKQKEISLDVVRRQLRGLGQGIGNVRSAKQFSIDLGVDFDNQTLDVGCEDARLHATSFVCSFHADGTTDAKAEDDMRSVMALVSRFVRKT